MQITYTNAQKQQVVFNVPPLNQTTLISTPEKTGAADIVSLSVMPVNQAVCNTVPSVGPPTTYDLREEFNEYLSPIAQQGSCGSCWAIASTLALASRFAVFRNQKVQPLSPAYLLYCTRDTFSKKQDTGYGCGGGSLVDAYWFFHINGVVTEECLPYSDAEENTLRSRQFSDDFAVTCPLLTCPRPDKQPWLFKTAVSYIVAGTPTQNNSSEANIRQEIWKNGPVSSGFQVTQDFFDFWKTCLSTTNSDAVYTPGPANDTTNPVRGNHAVQIVGWGTTTTTNTPFWIVANSWGATSTKLRDYGNNGYFRMRRGINAAAIESNVVAGLPRVHPNVVGALGKTAAMYDADLCDLVKYEVNIDTLLALDAGKFVVVPHVRTIYEFTLPPLDPANVATVRKFNECPDDRHIRCATTGLCVSAPQQCGPLSPSQGLVRHNPIVNNAQAAAREIQSKYVQQMPHAVNRRIYSPRRHQSSHCHHTGLIVLIVVGSLAFLLVLITFFYVFHKKQK